MGNTATLQRKPFTSDYQPANRGRNKGSRNRSTILREVLSLEHKRKNPITEKEEKAELEKHIEYSVVNKALEGDISAYKEIKDSLYGKIPNKEETKPEPALLTDEELVRELFSRMVENYDWTEEKAIKKISARFPQLDVKGLLNE